MSTAALQIVLEDLRQPDWQEFYVGDRKRYATASSVRFLDPHTIVCCAALARKIYLIRFDLENGSYETLDRADTMYAGNTVLPNLCDIDDRGNVIIGNGEAASMSLYRHDRGKICFARDLPTRLDGNFCHGARFCGPDVVVAVMQRDPRGAYFFNLQTMERLLYIETEHRTKDICFLSNDHAILVTTAGAPLPNSQEEYISEILRVKFDLKHRSYTVLKKQTYPVGQFDAVSAHENNVYVVDGGRGSVLTIDSHTLQQVGQLDGYDFPHGIDINYGMLAITSFGTNSIYIKSL